MAPTGQGAFDSLGRVQAVDRPGLSDLEITYDESGRVITTTLGTGPSARSVHYGYHPSTSDTSIAGQLATVDWPDPGLTQSFVPDVWGRTLSSVRSDGEELVQSYDPGGLVLSIQPPDRPAHMLTYTATGDLDLYTAPPASTAEPAAMLDRDYSLDRDLELETRADGTAVDFIYHPTTGKLSQASMPGVTVSYGYDPASGALHTATRVDSEGTHAITLSRNGAVLAFEQWSGSTGMTSGSVEHVVDANFWTTEHRVNSAATGIGRVVYSRDNDGLLTGAGPAAVARDATSGLPNTLTVQQTSSAFGWNVHGELAEQAVSHAGNALFTEAITSRDGLGRALSIEQAVIDAGGSLPITTREYTYDLAGRVESVREQGLDAASDTYDPNGNRLSRTTALGTVRGTYDDQDRLASYCPLDPAGSPEPISGLPCFDYAYKPSGELISKTDLATTALTQYEYDAGGDLTRVTLPDATVITYEIDGRGRRVGKRVNGTKRWGLVYRDGLRPMAELEPNGVLRSVFVYATSRSAPDAILKNSATYRVITDHLGSVRLVVNAATGAIAPPAPEGGELRIAQYA